MMITAAQIRLLPQSIDAFFEIYTARAGTYGNDGCANPVPSADAKKRRLKRRTAARAGAPAMTVARTRFPARRHKKRAAAKLTAARFGNVFDY